MKTIRPYFYLIVATAALTSWTAIAEPEVKGTPSELKAYLSGLPGTVQLLGEGEVKATADRAIISLRIDNENKSLAEALKLNQTTRIKLAAFLKEQGIGADRIQPVPFSSTQKTRIFSDKVKSHKVSTLVKVTVHGEQEFQAVTRSVDQFDGITYVQSEFEHSDQDALKTKATEKACDDVERQKRSYEEKLGVKLVPKNIGDVGRASLSIRKQAGDRALGFDWYLGNYLMAEKERLRSEPPEESPFGELVFSARVLVEYSVEHK